MDVPKLTKQALIDGGKAISDALGLDSTSCATYDLEMFHAMAALVRTFRGDEAPMDDRAVLWLMRHNPPLVYEGELLHLLVTDEGDRVVKEMLATFKEQT